MSSVEAGKRSWKCPQCGRELQLSMTQLDPIACDECLAKMKGGHKSGAGDVIADAVAGPMGIWQSLPEVVKLGAVVAALVIGLLIGFIGGQALSSHSGGPRSESTMSRSESSHASEPPVSEEPEERPEPPGPGYKWVRGRIRKDGTRPAGHWAKDPFYKGDEDASSKTSK